MKTGEKVRIIKPLMVKTSQAGKPDTFKPIVDKDGTWVQIQVLDGPRKGFRLPMTEESING